ncbi:MAG: excinuclease ABC subunit UvrA [Candidatus Margulisiibacteriota bacterium]
MKDTIFVKGAKVHNLKNIDCELPRNKLVVFTGLSGSGKSSLAFDTIYAEGQRRYVESLSAYARQFLGQMEKPDVELIEGLSPAISIEQKTTSKNPRSTVGTITEIYDYLRLLYAHIGVPHCPKCGKTIEKQSPEQIVNQLLDWPEGTKIQVLAPLVRGRKGEYKKLFADVLKDGFLRVRVDGKIYEIESGGEPELDKQKKHTIEIIIDRLIIKKDARRRLNDSIETALRYGNGLVLIIRDQGGPLNPPFGKLSAGSKGGLETSSFESEHLFSEHFACLDCGVNFPEITPRMFSFNNPYGACTECKGLGYKMEFEPALVVPDPGLSLNQGAVHPWRTQMDGFRGQAMESVARHFGFSLSLPFNKLPQKAQDTVLYGSDERIDYSLRSRTTDGYWNYAGGWEGIISQLERLYQQTDSEERRREMEQYMIMRRCPSCEGRKLCKESLAVTVKERSISELSDLSIHHLLQFFETIKLTDREEQISRQVIKEIKERLTFLDNVGLDYLTLSRTSSTLSGGESQRIRLATQIGSGLVGVLYILDEPSIGLHQRDNSRLLEALIRLRDLGNTLIVVEHDEETIRAADYIVDIGPGAGIHGGEIVAAGNLEDILKCEQSITGQYLSGKKSLPVPPKRRPGNGKKLAIIKAGEHNLRNIDVEFPLGKFIAVTGLSGSGKSTLVHDVLYNACARHFYRSHADAGQAGSIEGLEHIDKVIIIDQGPIGKTPRSNPATYTGLFTPVRELLARTAEAKMRGYKPGRFSFNVKGGRCEACGGDGTLKIEMHFLPDVYVTCEVCKGKRYNLETLEVRYKGKNIADILDLTVEEALEVFEHVPKIRNKLETLRDVGLGYIKLGQSSTTLSGGEAQRIKLATELSKRSTGKTLYILDEPTTGLHFEDVKYLLQVLNRLASAGNTLIVIEHNLDVIKTADWVIDLGPEGGDRGGELVIAGTPEEVAACDKSYTGQVLKKVLS